MQGRPDLSASKKLDTCWGKIFSI